MNINAATSFLKNSLSTGKDFTGVDKTRKEADRVDTELGRIHSDTVTVGTELGNLDEASTLKPPSFKQVTNKQLVMATTGGGAVLGGAFGLFRAVAAGPGTVNFNEVTHDIVEPKLNGAGFNIETHTTGPSPQNPSGWDVDITRRPLISEKVGEYTTREPVSSNTTSIALSGALGLAIGAGTGAIVGLAATQLRKVVGQGYDGTEERSTEGDKKVLITLGAAGAVVGGVAGAISSVAQSTTVNYDTQSYTTENKVIGKVPTGGGFWVPNNGEAKLPANAEAVVKMMDGNLDRQARDGYRSLDNLRPEEIKADVPKRTIFGKVDVDTEHKETSVGPGLLASIAGGAVIGGVTGVAGGVLVNVLRKTL